MNACNFSFSETNFEKGRTEEDCRKEDKGGGLMEERKGGKKSRKKGGRGGVRRVKERREGDSRKKGE